MAIKFGTTEHMELLNLQWRLNARLLNRLDLEHLDRLRAEVELKVEQINYEHNQSKKSHE